MPLLDFCRYPPGWPMVSISFLTPSVLVGLTRWFMARLSAGRDGTERWNNNWPFYILVSRNNSSFFLRWIDIWFFQSCETHSCLEFELLLIWKLGKPTAVMFVTTQVLRSLLLSVGLSISYTTNWLLPRLCRCRLLIWAPHFPHQIREPPTS